jgi:hypothetical protein
MEIVLINFEKWYQFVVFWLWGEKRLETWEFFHPVHGNLSKTPQILYQSVIHPLK